MFIVVSLDGCLLSWSPEIASNNVKLKHTVCKICGTDLVATSAISIAVLAEKEKAPKYHCGHSDYNYPCDCILSIVPASKY